MITQVLMKRELFGIEIKQQSKTEFFSASDLVKAGDIWRKENGLSEFQLFQFLKNKSTLDFIAELESKYGCKVIASTKGRHGQVWVHPLLFIDIALAINPKLKVEVYEWLFDNLIKFRNDSGDSYKEMSAALYVRHGNVREFPFFIQNVAMQIKNACGVSDWQTASELQLKKRDQIHYAVKLLCNVLNDAKQAVRIGIAENNK